MSVSQYDVIVVGSGPGGYVAAIRASQLGLKTAIVERDHLGGICSNWGCIPTKALLKSAEVFEQIQNAANFGIHLSGKVEPTLAPMIARSREVAERMANGVAMLMRKNKIDVIWGEARLRKGHQIEVVETAPQPRNAGRVRPKATKFAGQYQAKHIILATGARPRVLSCLEPDGTKIWSYFDALAAAEIPKHLLVVGSGAIGIEFASFFRTLGAEVSVVELAPQILPLEDSEISSFAAQQLTKRGISILTNSKVNKVEKTAQGLSAEITDTAGKTITLEASHVLSAVGVVPNSQGFEELGITLKNGFVVVDDVGRTSVPGLYAIGDVVGGAMLAHKAEHEAIIAVEAMAGLSPHKLNPQRIPSCIYSEPQIASVGLTEAKARAQGHELQIGKFPFMANGKAIALGADQGMVKVIFDRKTGELLGAHMIGPEVTEQIQGFVIAMELETTSLELAGTVFAHPTISEAMKEAVLTALGRAINI